MKPVLLGVNIDHIATLRQVRRTAYPDLLEALATVKRGGADGITVHLREDRRHIQPEDVKTILATNTLPLNLEMAVTDDMVRFAEETRPAECCFVPEKRQELTTEGGLDVVADADRIQAACGQLARCHIEVSLFVDPDLRQIEAARQCGAPVIEIHTGNWANADSALLRAKELETIATAARFAASLGLTVNAGHGLHCENIRPIAALPELHAVNIGHAIVARAVFCGLEAAVREMKHLLEEVHL